MATGKGNASVTVRGRFAPGSTVHLHLRRGDTFGPSIGSQKPVASAKYTKEGEATFKSLPSGETYWVSQYVDGEWRHAAATAKTAPEAKPKSDATLDPGWVGQGLGKRKVVEGARSTVDVKATREQTTIPKLHEKQKNPEMGPRVGQADVDGPQRSATPIGEGTPVDPSEQVPRPRQDEEPFDKGTVKQRSDTELGEATPKDPGEQVPARRQEDTAKSEKQRSNTEHGEAEPIPGGDPVEQTRRQDSSEAKARGETPGNPLEKSAGHKSGEGGAKRPRKAAKKSRKAPAKKAASSSKKSAKKSS